MIHIALLELILTMYCSNEATENKQQGIVGDPLDFRVVNARTVRFWNSSCGSTICRDVLAVGDRVESACGDLPPATKAVSPVADFDDQVDGSADFALCEKPSLVAVR